MARSRVHPGALSSYLSHDSSCSSSSSSCSSSSTSDSSTRSRQVLTVWMKSLVLHGNGCTVYDSDGGIVYRVDNYDRRSPGRAFIMDGHGRDVLAIAREKKFGMFGTTWDAYKCDGNGTWGSSRPGQESPAQPWFTFRNSRPVGLLQKQGRSSCCNVMTSQRGGGSTSRKKVLVHYRRERMGDKSTACRLVNSEGELLAEMKKKQTAAGVALGNDVFTLVVEPEVDVTLAVGVAVVYGMINRKM